MKRVPQIELPIVPRAIAEGVLEELTVWLGQPLPRRWIRELIAEANTVYAHNQRFRRRIRAKSDHGRDWLWVFMRHWLAALLYERRPQLHARLPAAYSTGHPLPPKPTARLAQTSRPRRSSSAQIRLPAGGGLRRKRWKA